MEESESDVGFDRRANNSSVEATVSTHGFVRYELRCPINSDTFEEVLEGEIAHVNLEVNDNEVKRMTSTVNKKGGRR
jgi:hypothetical protein